MVQDFWTINSMKKSIQISNHIFGVMGVLVTRWWSPRCTQNVWSEASRLIKTRLASADCWYDYYWTPIRWSLGCLFSVGFPWCLVGIDRYEKKSGTFWKCTLEYTGVSKNRGTPKSSILIGFSIINLPFWGTPIFGNTHTMLQGT